MLVKCGEGWIAWYDAAYVAIDIEETAKLANDRDQWHIIQDLMLADVLEEKTENEQRGSRLIGVNYLRLTSRGREIFRAMRASAPEEDSQ